VSIWVKLGHGLPNTCKMEMFRKQEIFPFGCDPSRMGSPSGYSLQVENSSLPGNYTLLVGILLRTFRSAWCLHLHAVTRTQVAEFTDTSKCFWRKILETVKTSCRIFFSAAHHVYDALFVLGCSWLRTFSLIPVIAEGAVPGGREEVDCVWCKSWPSG